MANQHKAMIPIELDKHRNLRFTLNSMAEVESRLGVKAQNLDKIEMGFTEARLMLWAALIHEDPDLTIEEVGNMVDFSNFQYVQEKVAEAYAVAQKKK